MVGRVAVLHIPTAEGLHHRGETVALVRGHEHVDMMRHQPIGMEDAVRGRGDVVQTLHVHALIILVQEDRLAIMPALEDMLGHVQQGRAQRSRHGRPHDQGPPCYPGLLPPGLSQGLQEHTSLTPIFQLGDRWLWLTDTARRRLTALTHPLQTWGVKAIKSGDEVAWVGC